MVNNKITTTIVICEHYNANCALGRWLRYKTTVHADTISYNPENKQVKVTGHKLDPLFLRRARYECELACRWKFNAKQLALNPRMR